MLNLNFKEVFLLFKIIAIIIITIVALYFLVSIIASIIGLKFFDKVSKHIDDDLD